MQGRKISNLSLQNLESLRNVRDTKGQTKEAGG